MLCRFNGQDCSTGIKKYDNLFILYEFSWKILHEIVAQIGQSPR
jgi:hypothetical protein